MSLLFPPKGSFVGVVCVLFGSFRDGVLEMKSSVFWKWT